MEAMFRWVHLADLGFGRPRDMLTFDHATMMRRLHEDIVAMTAGKGQPLDAIFITGDIAFQAGEREYAEAKPWISALARDVGLDRNRVFIVPGNHDVDRSADRTEPRRALLNELRSPHGSNDIDRALEVPGERAIVLERLEAYGELAAAFAPAPRQNALGWASAGIAWGRSRIRVAGLTTSLLSAEGGDRGMLKLGRAQIQQILRPPADHGRELTIVLGHHPLWERWLRDEVDARDALRGRPHIYLCGHVQDRTSEEARCGAVGDIARVTAGVLRDGHAPGVARGMGYNIGTLTRAGDTPRMRIQSRKASSRAPFFGPDIENLGTRTEHREHSLPDVPATLDSELEARLPPRAVSIARAKAPRARAPSDVYVCHFDEELSQPDMEALRDLGLHLKGQRLPWWDKTQIQPGEPRGDAIALAIRLSRVVVLLVSPQFQASSHIHENELPLILSRVEEKQAALLVVLVSPCLIEPPLTEHRMFGLPGSLGALTYNDRMNALVDIASAVGSALDGD